MPPPATPPPLLDDLIEEIFLRLSPDEPATLVRASLCSKACLSLLTGHSFNARYRKFHGSPPMLGFLYAWPINSGPPQDQDTVPPFVSTSSFGGARVAGGEDWVSELSDYFVWDCRHGRALLCDTDIAPTKVNFTFHPLVMHL
jgi:hypothetical protein